jgi:regulator of sigma E protease
MTTITQYLATILAFGAMIFFHELGHFLAARRAGVLVHAFAVGFGPKIIGWRRGPTTYSINLLPFGGFVRMEGEDTDPSVSEGSLRAKSPAARAGIIAAGPLMNLVLAVVILSIAAATGGVPTAASQRISTVEPGWPAADAGLRPGDQIVSIDGVAMTSGDQVVEKIHHSAGKPLALVVRRGTEEFAVTITPRLDRDRGVGRIGFSPEPQWTRQDPIRAVTWGVRRTGEFIVLLFGAIGGLIRQGRFFENLGGPLAAGNMLRQAAATGAQAFLNMTAFLSVMIGVFNLLPIPALDGGRLAFILVEIIRRKPVDPRREGWVHMVGFALLLLLLFVLTAKDIRVLRQ